MTLVTSMQSVGLHRAAEAFHALREVALRRVCEALDVEPDEWYGRYALARMSDASIPLPLDDSRWSALRHAYGPADDVPEMIAALARGDDRREPADMQGGVWDRIWSALCHQGGHVDTATFAAVPHIVAIGAARPRGEQLPFWSFAAAVSIARDTKPIPTDLNKAYRSAMAKASEAVAHCVVPGLEESEGCWALVAVAGLRQWSEVADALEGLADDEIAPECPGCGTQLYVSTVDVPSWSARIRCRASRRARPQRCEWNLVQQSWSSRSSPDAPSSLVSRRRSQRWSAS